MSRYLSLEEMRAAAIARDALVCACGHKCESHGSYTAEGFFQGIGGGQCGMDCSCDRFMDEARR